MSFDLKTFLDDLIPVLGEAGVGALAEELDELSAGQEGWKKSVLALLANAVEVYGPQGLDVGMDYLNKLLQGGTLPPINWADLEVASDILAHLQNLEADERAKWGDFLAKLSKSLGVILGALIRGLVSA